MKRWADSWRGGIKPADSRSDRPADAGGAQDDLARRWRLSDGQMQFLRYLLLLLAVGVVLMSLGQPRHARDVDTRAQDSGTRPPPAATYDAGPAADYARALERQVEEALRQLHGVGVVHVSVTIASGPRQVLAEHVTTERRVGDGGGGERVILDERLSAQPVLVRSDQHRQEHPIVLVEHAPQVSGVLVIVDAARDSRLRFEISRSVMTLLGLPAHRVYVLPQR